MNLFTLYCQRINVQNAFWNFLQSESGAASGSEEILVAISETIGLIEKFYLTFLPRTQKFTKIRNWKKRVFAINGLKETLLQFFFCDKKKLEETNPPQNEIWKKKTGFAGLGYSIASQDSTNRHLFEHSLSNWIENKTFQKP